MKKRIVTYGTSLTSTGNWVKMLKHKREQEMLYLEAVK